MNTILVPIYTTGGATIVTGGGAIVSIRMAATGLYARDGQTASRAGNLYNRPAGGLYNRIGGNFTRRGQLADRT